MPLPVELDVVALPPAPEVDEAELVEVALPPLPALLLLSGLDSPQPIIASAPSTATIADFFMGAGYTVPGRLATSESWLCAARQVCSDHDVDADGAASSQPGSKTNQWAGLCHHVGMM